MNNNLNIQKGNMGIRVILADEHRIMREGVRALLEKEPGIFVVAEADNGRQTVKLARKLLPDVVVMDIDIPEMNGIEATRRIVSEIPSVRVLMLTKNSSSKIVGNALSSGAAGYLLKDSGAEDLVKGIRMVATEQVCLSPEIVGVIVKNYMQKLDAPPSSPHTILTPREREVLQLIAEGSSTKEIASILGLSIKTIDTFRRLIMKKLNLRSIAELTKYAIREGITSVR